MAVALPAAFAAAASFFATPIIGSLTVGGLLSTVALSGASFVLNKALAKKPPGIAGTALDEGVKSTIQQATFPQRAIYGRAMVGGAMIFYECKPPFLYIGYRVASHEIDSVDEIRINGQKVIFDTTGAAASTNFRNGGTPMCYASVRLGTATQAQDAMIAAAFPEIAADPEWRQRSRAVVFMKFRHGGDYETHERFWGNTAIPRVEFVVRGMKVFDPNDATQSPGSPATWKWSDTSSLCLAHFMTWSRGGKRQWDQIDIPALRRAARDDERAVAIKNGGYEKRYTANGIIELNDDIGEAVQNLLGSNLGRMVWSDGSYAVYSGVARTPVWTLNDDSARGDMEIQNDRPRRDLVNTVRTLFVSPDREYQTANGPVVVSNGYVSGDGEIHEITLTLPFTDSHTRAQRIAKAVMEKSRLGKTVSRRESIDAVRLNAADIVNIEVNFMPVLSGVFEINRIDLDHETFEFTIEAEQYSPAIFDWNAQVDEQDFIMEPAELAGVN